MEGSRRDAPDWPSNAGVDKTDCPSNAGVDAADVARLGANKEPRGGSPRDAPDSPTVIDTDEASQSGPAS